MHRQAVRIFFSLIFLSFGLVLTGPALSEDVSDLTVENQEKFKDVADQLRCPTCNGLSVLGSDAPFSLQIRAKVKEQVNSGKSQKEILDYFTTRYGAWILREPPKTGFNLFAWIFPSLLLILGPGVVWFLVWRKRKTFDSFGLRSTQEICAEFDQALASMRQRGSH